MEETVTVYLFLPLEQFLILPNTPTLIPGDAVAVLTWGVVTSAQLVPPPAGLPFWADNGMQTKVKHARAKTISIKRLGITNSPYLQPQQPLNPGTWPLILLLWAT
jgi:hypothetical protein